MPSQIAQREKYRPSGRVSWGKFAAFYAVSLLVAVLLSWAMYTAFAAGWYIMFLMPAFAALVVGGMLSMTVRVGKCRKPLAAGIAGIVAGIVLYLGTYYFGLMALTGVHGAWRVNLLPTYIKWRMQTDLHRNVGHPDPGNAEREPDPVMNWILFGVEFAMVLWLTGLLVRRRAMKPFCERCDAWKQQDVNTYPPGNGNTIRGWLEAGELGRLAGMPIYTPSGKQNRFTSASVESCATSRTDDPCPVYFAVKDVSLGGNLNAFQRFDGSPGKMRVPRIELTEAEVAALQPAFPRLQLATAETGPVPFLTRESASPLIPAAFGGGALIDVQPVPEGEARQVLNARSIAVGNILVLMTLVIFFGSIAGFAYGIHLSNALEVLDHKAQPELARMAIGLGLAALSLLLAFVSGYVGLRNSSAPGNNYYHRRARHHFGMRVSPIVDLIRPSDQPTFFVEVVPRKNWGKVMLETATDIGFLEVDGRRRELRFEGDRERYRIPAAAITSCVIQQITPATGDGKIVYHMVVLSGNTRGGPWEAPFCLRQTAWKPPKNHRAAGAASIYSSICTLAPWVIPGVAERITAGAGTSPLSAIPTIPAPLNPAQPFTVKERFFRRHGLRLTIIVLAVGLGIWRAAERRRARKAAENQMAAVELGSSDRRSLRLHLSNIRLGQKLTDAPPYFTAGGTWTVFDCVPIGDESAGVTVAVQPSTQPVDARIPVSFSMAALLPTRREFGRKFVDALAKALDTSSPPVRDPQLPLVPLTFPTAILGRKLSAPAQGLKSAAGTWVATKWFIPFSDDSQPEIFFNFDLAGGNAEFSEKDPDYNAALLSKLAAVLRDGMERKPASTRPDSQASR